MSQAGGEAPTSGGKASGGVTGSAGAPTGGADTSAGAAGAPAGGAAGAGGSDGVPQGGQVAGGSAGEGGAPPDPSIPPPSTTCEDGCASLYVPFTNGAQQQFFTLQLGSANLSNSIVTAKVRVVKFGCTAGFMKLYASSIDNFDYYGGPNLTYIAEGDEKILTLDLTGNPKNLSGNDWNNEHVFDIGIQINSQPGAQFGPIFLEVEEISVSDDAIPAYTFTTAAKTAAFVANPYAAVEGSAVRWVPPTE